MSPPNARATFDRIVETIIWNVKALKEMYNMTKAPRILFDNRADWDKFIDEMKSAHPMGAQNTFGIRGPVVHIEVDDVKFQFRERPKVTHVKTQAGDWIDISVIDAFVSFKFSDGSEYDRDRGWL